MGQLTSRPKRNARESAVSEAGPSSQPQSRRRSIFGSSGLSEGDLTTKKRWRASKRWSRAKATEDSKDKGKEREVEPIVEAAPEPQPSPVVISRPATPEVEEPPSEPVAEEMPLEEPPPAPPIVTSPPIDHSLPPPRHFPPPGTLVVVQGVVNTTDNNPNNNNNNSLFPPLASRSSRSPTPTRGSRLSSIIRRPTSMFNDNRPSSENDTTTDSSVEPNTDDSSLPHTDTSSATTVESSDNDGSAQTAQQQHQRPLSPGSIDVLGTLLSVAAAATAASLFSPNSFSPRPNESSPESDSTRPTSPTPTAGLGVNGYGPLDTLVGLGFPMDRESQPQPAAAAGNAVNRDRLRGAWDTLRDRLGLHNERPGEDPSHTTHNDDGEETRPSGPGDTMISEMARALGTGLGLQEEGASQRSTNAPTDTPAGDVPASPTPAEGTFERFLLNLQADLRTVLSEDVTAEAPVVDTEPPLATDELPRDDSNAQVPAVEEATESDGPTTSPTPEPSTPFHIPQTNPIPQLNHDRRAGGGINLWRSYRFPPIVAPARPSPLYQPGSPIPAMGNPVPTTTDPSPAYLPSMPSTTVPLQSTEPSALGAAPPALDIVVPVIIVGLQSVNVDPRGGEQNDDHENMFARPESAAEAGDQDSLNGSTNLPDQRPDTPRGRPWHSRAATALRNLRPGRRPDMSATGPHDRNASRTFLIYVIGGYYPPNHHIVTGTDGMDSYEALWELAALLGQVKPPVATPEEIEKSGLHTIKPAEIEQWNAEGRVAPNCIDRCLICLDDYDPEDDLRVMSCKHFFHQTCVDRWLQTGRNNCPACRTKGVSTGNDPTDTANTAPTSPITAGLPPVV